MLLLQLKQINGDNVYNEWRYPQWGQKYASSYGLNGLSTWTSLTITCLQLGHKIYIRVVYVASVPMYSNPRVFYHPGDIWQQIITFGTVFLAVTVEETILFTRWADVVVYVYIMFYYPSKFEHEVSPCRCHLVLASSYVISFSTENENTVWQAIQY